MPNVLIRQSDGTATPTAGSHFNWPPKVLNFDEAEAVLHMMPHVLGLVKVVMFDANLNRPYWHTVTLVNGWTDILG
jgi:hypothetical protein